MSEGRDKAQNPKILVWDVPTRLVHWLVAVLVLVAYVTYRLSWIRWHVLSGDAVLALVLFRILWGFFGSEPSRFTAFVAAPGTVYRYLRRVARLRISARVGHNPAGGWMILILFALLLGETLSGIFVNNDVATVGPMSSMTPESVMNLVTDLHRILWDALLAAIVVHVLAILFYAVALRQSLLLPMITGRKSLPETTPRPRIAGSWRAAWLFGCGVAAAAALAKYL